MIIALTGTPGTGKTTVCDFIAEHSQYRKQYRIIDLIGSLLMRKFILKKKKANDRWTIFLVIV